jgi:hypothetical protein
VACFYNGCVEAGAHLLGKNLDGRADKHRVMVARDGIDLDRLRNQEIPAQPRIMRPLRQLLGCTVQDGWDCAGLWPVPA